MPATNLEVLDLARKFLTQEEIDEYYLRAFHRLTPQDREAIEDAALVLISKQPALQPPDALHLLGQTSVIGLRPMRVRRGKHVQFTLWEIGNI